MKIRDSLTSYEIETDDLELMWASKNLPLPTHNGSSREFNSKIYFTGNLYFFVKKMIERNKNNEIIEELDRIKPIPYSYAQELSECDEFKFKFKERSANSTRITQNVDEIQEKLTELRLALRAGKEMDENEKGYNDLFRIITEFEVKFYG